MPISFHAAFVGRLRLTIFFLTHVFLRRQAAFVLPPESQRFRLESAGRMPLLLEDHWDVRTGKTRQITSIS